jgi:acetyl esterase/lipase
VTDRSTAWTVAIIRAGIGSCYLLGEWSSPGSSCGSTISTLQSSPKFELACSQPDGGRSTRLNWVLTPARIIVAGDSAGGTLAAATTLRLRDEGGPLHCGQLLMYPVTDYHTPGTPSYDDNAEGYELTRDTMK